MSEMEIIGVGDLIYRGVSINDIYNSIAEPISKKIVKMICNLCIDDKKLYSISWEIKSQTSSKNNNIDEIKKEHKNIILDNHIEFLNLNIRILNCLKSAGIKTIGELIDNTKRKLRIIPNFGIGSLRETQNKLSCYGLKLKE